MTDEEHLLPWKPTEVEGVQWLPLHLHESERTPAKHSTEASPVRPGATVLIRMAPGASYGAHRHLGWEQVLVLRGGYADEQGEYRTGQFVHYPAGSTHTPVALGDGTRPEGPGNLACVLFAVAAGGIELLKRDES